MTTGPPESERCPVCGAGLAGDGLCLPCAMPRMLGVAREEWIAEEEAAEAVRKDHDEAEVEPGMNIGGYELLEPLSSGAMGLVFRARHVRLRREAAVKVMRHAALAGPRERERFRAEAEALARLDHPGVAQCFESGEHAGLPWLAMRLAEGVDFQRALPAWLLPEQQDARAAAVRLAQLFMKLAQALHYAHQRGVVHRDLKPANVIIGPDGAPCLVDFGIARLSRDEEEMERVTRHGEFMGTPAFAAPEVLREGARAATALSDIWSAGMMLYECLAGRLPHDRDAAGARTLPAGPVVAPRRWNPRLDADLEAVCLRCLEREPARRYASADALAADLSAWLERRPVSARRLSPVRLLWRAAQRRPLAAAVLTLSAVCAVALPLWLQARLRAEQELNLRQAERVRMQSLQRVLEPLSAGRPLTALRTAFSAAVQNGSGGGWESDLPATLLHAGRLWTRQIPGAQTLAWSADGGTLAAGDAGGRVVFLNAQGEVSGSQPVPWPEGDAGSAVLALAFTSSGQVAAACAGQPVVLWRPLSPEPALVTSRFAAGLTAFSQGGLLTGGAHALLDAAVLTADGGMSHLPDSGGLIAADGGVVFTAGRSNHLCRWEQSGGQWRGTARLPLRGPASLLAAGGGMVAWVRGSEPDIIRLRRTAGLALWEESLPGHEAGVTALAFSPDGRVLASGGADGMTVFREMPSGRVLRRVPALARVRAMALSAATAAVLTDDGLLTAWPLAPESGSVAASPLLAGGAPFAVVEEEKDGLRFVSPDAASIRAAWPAEQAKRDAAGVSVRGEVFAFHALAGAGTEVSMERLSRGDGILVSGSCVPLQKWPAAHDLLISGPAVSTVAADGSAVAALFRLPGRPSFISIWALPAGTQNRVIEPPAGLTVDTLGFSPDGARLLVDYSRGVVAWYDLSSGDTHRLTAAAAAFGVDGTLLLSMETGGIRVLDAETQMERASAPDVPPARMVAPSRDGRLAACAVETGGIVIVHPASGTQLATLEPSLQFRTAAFLENDAALVAADTSGRLWFWSRRRAEEVLPEPTIPTAAPAAALPESGPFAFAAGEPARMSPLMASLAARAHELPLPAAGGLLPAFRHVCAPLAGNPSAATLSMTLRSPDISKVTLSLALPAHPDPSAPGSIRWSLPVLQLADADTAERLRRGEPATLTCDLSVLPTAPKGVTVLLPYLCKTRRLEIKLSPNVQVENLHLTWPGTPPAAPVSMTAAATPAWPENPGAPLVSLSTRGSGETEPAWVTVPAANAGTGAIFRWSCHTPAPGRLRAALKVSGELTSIRLDGRVIFADRMDARYVPVLVETRDGEPLPAGPHVLEVEINPGLSKPTLFMEGGIWPAVPGR